MLDAKRERTKYRNTLHSRMNNVKVGNKEYALEDNDAALVEAILLLIFQIRRLADNG